MDRIDLEAYLRRIGYEGPRGTAPETLRRLHRLHPEAIAFENLDPLLERPVALAPDALEAKLVHGGRGGYCFEQNLLFMHALRALGFTVSGLAARVVWNQPEDTLTPRGHMLLRVTLGDTVYIADVGFGGLTLTAPLVLEAGRDQETPHETMRLERAGTHWRLRALIGTEWRSLYTFQLEEHFQVDYEVSNYYLSSNPTSHFRHSLIAARSTPEGRHALLNNRLSFHDGKGGGERRDLQSAREIRTVLTDTFGIAVPSQAALTEALRRENIV